MTKYRVQMTMIVDTEFPLGVERNNHITFAAEEMGNIEIAPSVLVRNQYGLIVPTHAFLFGDNTFKIDTERSLVEKVMAPEEQRYEEFKAEFLPELTPDREAIRVRPISYVETDPLEFCWVACLIDQGTRAIIMPVSEYIDSEYKYNSVRIIHCNNSYRKISHSYIEDFPWIIQGKFDVKL